MSLALAQALLLADAVTPDAMGKALHLSAARGVSLVRSLQALRAIDPARLEQQLEKGEAPAMRHVAPVLALVDRLPPGLCERLLVLPVRQDPRTGTVDVAVVDARDGHGAGEVAFWLGAPVRTVRTSLASMDAALRRLEERPASLGMEALAPPMGVGEPAPAAERDERTPTGPNIPIPLTRRNTASIEAPLRSVPVEERAAPGPRDPVLDLMRRKPSQGPAAVPPASVPPASVPPPPTQRGPFPPSAPVAPPPASRAALAPAPAPDRTRAPVPAPAAPAAPPAPAPPPVDIFAELEKAHDRDRIVELVVIGTHTVARRVAILAVRRDGLAGWACSPEVADPAAFRQVRIPTATPTVLSEALEQGGAWLARFPRDLPHAPLLAILQPGTSEDVAIAGVRVEGRTALAILATDLADASRAKKHVAELALKAGDALARLLRERRK